MRTSHGLLALLLASAALAQTTPAGRTAPRTGQTREAGRPGSALPPDPDLFDGSKFEAEKRPETGMIGEFEMPGGDAQNPKVGGDPGEAGGNQAPPKPGAAGAAGAAGATSGGGAPSTPGSEQAGGGESVENSGAAGAVGGALDQRKPTSSSGQAGAGDPNAKAEGVAADRLEGGGAGGAAAAQKAAGQGNKSKSSASKIGSAELRIDALPESDKDVVGREAAPGGTQGSNRDMPAGKGGQGSNNQNKGVEKGKVIPKGL